MLFDIWQWFSLLTSWLTDTFNFWRPSSAHISSIRIVMPSQLEYLKPATSCGLWNCRCSGKTGCCFDRCLLRVSACCKLRDRNIIAYVFEYLFEPMGKGNPSFLVNLKRSYKTIVNDHPKLYHKWHRLVQTINHPEWITVRLFWLKVVVS